jgi:D-amino-acid dehydrogenase
MPEINIEQPKPNTVWSGLRPCSIDGLSYIGRVNNYNNVVVATGHSMMGISLAPATGKLVEEIISRKNTSFDIKAFNPVR